MTEYIKSEKGYFYKITKNTKERVSKKIYDENTFLIKSNNPLSTVKLSTHEHVDKFIVGNIQNAGFLKNNINNSNNSDYKKYFYYFLENSKIEYMAKGVSGIIFKAVFNIDTPNICTSPYIYINPDKYNQPLKYIIFKLIFLNNYDNNDNKYKSIKLYNNNTYKFSVSSIKSFTEEINIQTDIFLQTINYMEPYCPEILYADIYNNNEIDIFIDIIKKNLNNEKHKEFTIFILNNIKKFKINNINNINNININGYYNNLGIITMNYEEDYYTLHNYMSKFRFKEGRDTITNSSHIARYTQYNLYKNMSLYLLIKLAVDTGYTQGDFHPSNVMINPIYKNYFKGIDGAPLIIDFGYSKKIDKETHDYIKECFSKKQYITILKILCEIGRTNTLNMTHNNYKSIFGWVCGTYNYYTRENINNKNILKYETDLNNILDILNNKREESKKELIKIFEKKHLNSPNNSISLPINNNIIKKRIFTMDLSKRSHESRSPENTGINKKEESKKKLEKNNKNSLVKYNSKKKRTIEDINK